MRITVVTVCLNSQETIGDTIASVRDQAYPDIEYLIIDGGSTDRTLEIVNTYRSSIARVVSEPDRGLYDAMNKGLSLATGDVVCFLNSDDMLFDSHVLAAVADEFVTRDIGCLYGDVVMVNRRNKKQVHRKWTAGSYRPGLMQRGWQIPHPTFFAKTSLLRFHGGFNTSYRYSADYELVLRLLVKSGTTVAYLPRFLIRMRAGGVSNRSVRNIVRANLECARAWRDNGLRVPLWLIPLKIFRKLLQVVKR